MKRFIFLGLILILAGYSATSHAQTDTEFWFVVPELSHRGNTGGTPGTLRVSTLELDATVTISMPANQYHPSLNPTGFQDIIIDIPANSASNVDLTHLIDDAANPNRNLLENKALTPDGINNFGLHITSTNMITAFWEINYDYGSDLWTLKGTNGLGHLFYTPFQDVYDNRNITPRAYSAIDLVATHDNTQVTITLPPGKAASYGSTVNAIPPGGTQTVILNSGQTFSLFPHNYSVVAADRLGGTRIESTLPISVCVKDDALNTGSQGQPVIGDQLVPVDKVGDDYIVPDINNPNHVYVLATEDNTSIYVTNFEGMPIGPTPYFTLNRGEQGLVLIPNGSKFAHITSKASPGDPYKPFYVFQLTVANQTRGGALVPSIGCTGNTQLSFTRAREGENIYYLYLITEAGNEDKFIIDGIRRDGIIDPGAFTPIAGSSGWVAQLTNSINASVLPAGQHLMENTGGVFHLGIMNGFPGAGQGGFYYGFHSDFGRLNVGATVAGTNSSVVRTCYGDPVPLNAYGGTTYNWTPDTYLNDATSNVPVASNLPVGPHDYTVEVSGACGSGVVDLTILVSDSAVANFHTSETSGCSPLEVTFEDQSYGAYSWQYDLGDGSPSIIYDLNPATPYPEPPDPFTFTNTYINTTNQPVDYEITLLVKNISGCHDIISKTITVYPDVQSDFIVNPTEACSPAEITFQDRSAGAALYSWDFGDGGSSAEQNPIHLYNRNILRNDTVFTVTLVTTSMAECRDTAKYDVVIHPYIEAAFTVEDVLGCNPFTVSINNESIGVDHYLWDFGDGSMVSTTADETLSHLYLNPTNSTVVYPLQLVVFNEEGCGDTLIREITVHPDITANFTADNLEGCSPLEVIYTDLSVNAVLYSWEFGDETTSTENSPVHTYSNVGTTDSVYITTLTTSTADGECVKSIEWPITVHPQVVAEFTFPDSPGCSPLEATFENLSSGGTSFTWDFGDGTDTTTTVPESQTHTFINTDFANQNVFEVSLRVVNDYGCVEQAVHIVTVDHEILAGFITSVVEGCDPLEVEFSNTSAGASNFLWDYGDGETSDVENPMHIYTNPSSPDMETYNVNLIAIGPGSCRDTSTLPISVSPYVEASFDMDSAICHLTDVPIRNNSVGADVYSWNFGDGSPISTSPGPDLDHYYINVSSTPVNYTVELTIENEEGCTHQLQREVVVYPESEGGILKGNTNEITFGSSTGQISLSDHIGEVMKWQKIVKAGPWEDIAHTENYFSEIPVSADLWQYRAVVQSGACEEKSSDLFSIFVLPKELIITPTPEQTKREGDTDPVFTFTNSEWNDDSNFTGALRRNAGEAPGEYEYLLGDLSAGSDYVLAMNPDATKFTITSTVGIVDYSGSKGLTLNSYSNPFQESTSFRYSLPFDGRVTLSIRNMAGQVVKTVVQNKLETKGVYSLVLGDFNLEPGIYFATMMLTNDQEAVACTLKLMKSR